VTSPVLVLATRNPGKIAELRGLLAAWPWQLQSLDDAGFDGQLEEPGPGYVESALAKASAVCDATGLPSLADDSGIEVDALRGWPGPLSARWMGEGATDADRLQGLLDEVARRSPHDRRVRYVCVAALARPEAEPVTARGECLGTLIESPRGHNGFGYDPVFLSVDLGVTFGEASDEAKARVSHRARAIARLGEAGVLEPARAG
jgi:XTP/dITP diphosphohydrolase